MLTWLKLRSTRAHTGFIKNTLQLGQRIHHQIRFCLGFSISPTIAKAQALDQLRQRQRFGRIKVTSGMVCITRSMGQSRRIFLLRVALS